METKSNEWKATQRKNERLVAYWAGAWVLTMAVASFGPLLLWDNSGISILAILINTILGVGMILALRKSINGSDEMQKKVAMEAMALALGAGVVGGLSYSMLDVAKVIPFDAEISHLVVLMTITFLIASRVGNIRYK